MQRCQILPPLVNLFCQINLHRTNIRAGITKRTSRHVPRILLRRLQHTQVNPHGTRYKIRVRISPRPVTKLIKISLWNTHGTQFLSKNPPHTGRVRELVKMFPNAKFIYLMRNPYTVFESTRSFFTNTIQPLKLQDITPAELHKRICSGST